jgi:hypothetical protein
LRFFCSKTTYLYWSRANFLTYNYDLWYVHQTCTDMYKKGVKYRKTAVFIFMTVKFSDSIYFQPLETVHEIRHCRIAKPHCTGNAGWKLPTGRHTHNLYHEDPHRTHNAHFPTA